MMHTRRYWITLKKALPSLSAHRNTNESALAMEIVQLE
jgi:hypothetical protein